MHGLNRFEWIRMSTLRNIKLVRACVHCSVYHTTMDSSTICQAPPQAAYFLWICDNVYHKQDVCFPLYFLGQTVSWQYNPNLLELKLTMYRYKWFWLTIVEMSIRICIDTCRGNVKWRLVDRSCLRSTLKGRQFTRGIITLLILFRKLVSSCILAWRHL